MYLVLCGFAASLTYFGCAQAYQYSTATLCTTQYGAKPVSVKTTSYAITIPITAFNQFSITPTVTVTPPPTTSTFTTTTTVTSVVVTTPIVVTSTETDLTTLTLTTTTTVTTDTTTTSTTTNVIGTFTVPTSAGFTPLASGPGYFAKKRSIESSAVPAPRGRHIEERADSKRHLCPPIGKPFPQYPRTVICGALIVAETTSTQTYTATITATSTLPPATSTSTSTVTTTETITSPAVPASTTITTSLTVYTLTTATLTTTTTVTQTVTIDGAASTVYAACDSNNVISRANGNLAILEVFYNGPGDDYPTTYEVSTPDPVACCQYCQQAVGCTGYSHFPPKETCYYFTRNQCDGSKNFDQYFSTSSGDEGYTVGNGQCGQIYDIGD